MDDGLSRIMSSAIVVVGILLIVWGLTREEHNYATVHFGDGYVKIGIIYEEKVSSKAKITLDGEVLFEGDINGVIDQILTNSSASTTWRKGVTLNVTTSIYWSASRQDFELKTDGFDVVSDGTLLPRNLVEKLQGMLSQSKANRESVSSKVLTFSNNPHSSSIGQVLSILK